MKTKINSIHVSIVAISAHIIPMAGVFMEGKWYKYPYVLISYIIGIIILLFINKLYLKNIKQ